MLEVLVAAAATLACQAGAHAPLIAAHRGGMDSGHAENTLPAFSHAVRSGARFIELDIRTTADGETVVIHDRRVDRTTDGRGLVHRLPAATVAALDAGGGARVPTLLQALEALAPSGAELLLDVKRDAPGLDHGRLAAAVREGYPAGGVVFGVRTLDDLAALALTDPSARFLGLVPAPAAIDDFIAAGVEAIRLWPAWLTREPALVERVHAAGARVWVTAGNAGDGALRALAGAGVDVLLTDRPAAALRLFDCR